MTNFSYRARDRYGILTSGRMEAADSRAVALHLSKMGLTPISISTVEDNGFLLKVDEWLGSFQKIKPEELVIFTRQLASVLEAGVSLTEGLEAVAEQIYNKRLRSVVLEIKRNIEGGVTFSEALEKHQKVFSNLVFSMVRVGEKAGILPQVLDRISNLLEKEIEIMDKIKAATRYPLIVLITLCAAFVIVSVYVIPRFANFFMAFKTELPLPTRILIGINYFITNYWYWFVGVLAIGIYSFRKWLETEKGRYRWDRLVLSTPIFGPLFLKIYISRFGRMLAAMLKSGIPILDALTVASATVENKVISRVVIDIRDDVSEGKNLAEPMKGSNVFPPIAVSMVAIGERTGSLENMLEKLADYFDREADYTIKNLTFLLEPILIFGLAFVLLIFALGIFLPMWDLVKVYKSF